MSISWAVHRAIEEVPCPDQPPCTATHRRMVGGSIYCINGISVDRDRFRRIVGWCARRQGWTNLTDAIADGWPA